MSQQNIKVNLQFGVDTSQAMRSLQQLQTSLNGFMDAANKGDLPINAQLQKAQQSAMQLQAALKSAVNVDTGKFDLSKFSSSLKSMGTSLDVLKSNLTSVGPQGQQAFMSLAQAIASAEVPLRRTSGLLTSLGTTLKNTIKWQLSSSLIQGFTRSIGEAYNYSKDLNESLNNIRIVTGQSVEDMAKFAKQANQAAKALSTTTNEYAKASLIFYQQGLNGNEVTDRANVVIKMANVTGQAADVVSDQMTAVWNNFYDGSQSLESFADKLTALGAATASSTDEISQGLEKFAAVADTVGLSYDYATAALATVTSQTRQSADVVGTAFKTLFARIQDLELGETLDDGTTLGSYSESLAKVGVNIKDTNGELKDMDTILNEMGTKWKTLEKDQQVALAKSVAGIRQYTQLIALMDNWNFMQENLSVARNATGALQDQAEIYAESWEAASDRVKAATEELWSELIHDEFFIDLFDGFTKVIGFVSKLTNALGGAQGVVMMLGSVLLKVFGTQLATSLSNLTYGIKTFFGFTQKNVMAMKELAIEQAKSTAYSMSGSSSDPVAGAATNNFTNSAQVEGMTNTVKLQEAMVANKEKLTDLERIQYEVIMQQNEAMNEQLALMAQEVDKAGTEYNESSEELQIDLHDQAGVTDAEFEEVRTKIANSLDLSAKIQQELEEANQAFLNAGTDGAQTYFNKLKALSKEAEAGGLDTTKQIIDSRKEQFAGDIAGGGRSEFVQERAGRVLASAKSEQASAGKRLKEAGKADAKLNAQRKIQAKYDKLEAENQDIINESIEKNIEAKDNLNKTTKKYNATQQEANEQTEKGQKTISNFGKGAMTVTQGVIGLAQGAMSITMAFSSLSNLFDTLTDSSASFGDKVSSVFMSLGMAIPMLVSGIKGLITSTVGVAGAIAGNIAATYAQITLSKIVQGNLTKENALKAQEILLKGAAITEEEKETAAKLLGITVEQLDLALKNKEIILEKKGIMSKLAYIATKKLETKAKQGGIWAKLANIVATEGETAANTGLLASMLPILLLMAPYIAAILGLVAAVAILVVGITQLSNAYNADAIAAEEAATTASNLAAAYDECKQAYENMISAMDKYESAKNSLKELTKGTVEYEKAIQDANAEALKLIETYKNLKYEFNQDTGLIEIDPASMDAVKRAELRQLKAAQDASIMANIDAKQAATRSSQTNLAREKLSSKAGDGLTALAITSSILNPLAIGANAALFAEAEQKETEKEREALEKLADAYANIGEAAFEDGNIEALELDDKKLIESLKNNRIEITKLVKEMHNNSIETKKNTEAIIGDVAGDQAGMLSGYYLEQVEYYGNIYDDMINQINRTEDYGENADITNFIDTYDKIMGTDFAKKLSLGTDDVQKTDKGLVISWMENGEQQTKLLTDMVSTLKTQSAKTSTANKSNALDQKFITSGLSSNLQDVIKMAALGDGKFATEMTQAQLEELRAKGVLTTDNQINREALEEMLKSVGVSIETMAKDAGFKTAEGEADIEAFLGRYKEIGKAEEMFKDLYSKTKPEVQRYFDSLVSDPQIEEIFKNAKGTVQIEFRDFLVETFRMGGQKGLDAFTSIWNDLPESELDEFLNGIGNIDWTTATSESIQQSLNELGIETNISTNKLQNLINIMKDGNIGLDNITQQTKKLVDVVKDIKPGDIISAENYQLLADSELGLEKYFTLMYDGTYQLTNAALDFQKIIAQATVSQLYTNIQKIDENLGKLQTKIKNVQSQNLQYNQKYEDLQFNEGYNYWVNDEGNLESYNESGREAAWQEFWTLVDNNELYENLDTTELDKKYQIFGEGSKMDSNLQFKKDGVRARKENGDYHTYHTITYDEMFEAFAKKQGYGDFYNQDNPTAMGQKLEEMWNLSALMGYEDRLKTELNMNSFNLEEFMKNYDSNLQTLQGIYKEAGEKLDGAEETIQAQLNEIALSYQAIASTATSMEELDTMYQQYGENFKYAYEIQAAALDQKREYQDFDMEEVREYAEHLQEIAYDTDMVSNELANNEEAAQKTAIATMRLNKGIEELSEGFEEWNEILLSSDEGSQEYYEALSSLRKAMADLLGISEKSLSKEFLTNANNLNLMQKAAEGSAEAIDELAFLAAKDYILNIEGIDGTLETEISSFMEQWKDYVMEIRVGASIDSTEFENGLEKILNSTKLTQAQFEEFLNAWQLEYEGEPPTYTETELTGGNPILANYEADISDLSGAGATSTLDNGTQIRATRGVRTWTVQEGTAPVKQTVITPGEKGIDVKKIRKSTSGAMSNFSTKNSGGSKSSTPDKKKKSDIVERYKEVNDQIDNVSRAYENASKAADRLYGKARLNQMKEMNKILANEVDLLAEKRKEAEDYLQTDQSDLNTIAQENIGLQFEFDSNTRDITNYQEVMEAVWRDYDAYYESAKSGGFSETEQERLDDYDKAISNVQNAVSQYDDTRELLEDIDDEIQNKLYEMQDNNYEQFTYQIDMELEIRDLKLDFNKYQIDSIMADLLEAGASDNISRLLDEQLNILNSSNNVGRYKELQEQYALGEANMEAIKNGTLKFEDIDPAQMGISQAEYAEGLQNEYQYTMDNIEALKELDEFKRSYYGETLSAANEEIEKYTSLMQDSSEVLDHYKNLMELTGKGTDYKKIGKILEGEAKTAANMMAVSAAVYENRMQEANKAYVAYQDAIASGASKETVAMLEETWITAQTAANEAQAAMLEDTAAFAEAQKAILENTLADLGKSLEQAVSGRFGSYTDLTTALDRAAATTEEWLTNTNKIYETDKLINKAQKDIDNTTNTVAKRKLQNYIKETEQLQKRTKLSNFELEIQKAKYELLLAEIALEEAQNAKSTVRLKRDAQGNFGYVYTADQKAIDEAQQKYKDAENSLYNIRLEGSNNYTQKALELQMEFADTMQELNQRRLDGEFATEQEYQNALLAAKEYYYKQLDTYSYLYSVSIEEDTRIAADAWSTEFQDMVVNTENWKINVNTYISEVDGAFGTWKSNISDLYGETGILSQIEQGVEGVKTTAEALKTLLIGEEGDGGIVKNTSELTEKALELATQYATIRNTIVGEDGLIKAYDDQLQEIVTLIDKLSELDNTSINVNQTVTEVQKLDVTEFDAAVRKFSQAVGGYNPHNNNTEDSRIGSIISNYNDSASHSAWSKNADGTMTEGKSLTSKDIVGAQVLNTYADPGGQGDWLQVKNRNNDIFWVWEKNINYAEELLGQTVTALTQGVDYSWYKDANGKMQHSRTRIDSQQVKGSKIVSYYPQDDGLWIQLNSGIWLWYGTTELQDLQLDFDHLSDTVSLPAATITATPYDTGGYTGEWGPEGKLAMLHQKEIVLNKDDTANFLSALGLLDNILLTLDKYSVNAQLSGLLSSPAFNMNNSDTLEQNVHIEASFPGISDRNELEEAFNNLINRASQYANRK